MYKLTITQYGCNVLELSNLSRQVGDQIILDTKKSYCSKWNDNQTVEINNEDGYYKQYREGVIVLHRI